MVITEDDLFVYTDFGFGKLYDRAEHRRVSCIVFTLFEELCKFGNSVYADHRLKSSFTLCIPFVMLWVLPVITKSAPSTVITAPALV